MSKNSVLVLSEILELFGNILTPDDKYSLSINRVFNATNSDPTISKSKIISEVFSKFPKSTKIRNTLKKKMTLIGDFFVKLQTGNSGVT